ncbi:nuclease-related domain-containing protein [Bacillus sp. THAF10]|uniref:nuclease-related domain-containing protein n=1 Tax=Bacillus sp. THAF10 TaxID=2587848 RepID=UPI001C12AB96|nr:nuclease-related domain-containing protein [Bacillus sp. THAF10]
MEIFNSLHQRMDLTVKDKQYLDNLRKGYEGEIKFDCLLEEHLHSDCLILNDLLLRHHNSVFQIDSLLLFQDSLYLFEVKNFEGDFIYRDDRFYLKNKTKTEITSPLVQLQRCETLFRQLLQKLGYQTPVHAFVAFVHPEFTLYQAPIDKPLLFPSQLKRTLGHLNVKKSVISPSMKALASQLVSLHITDYPFENVPSYDFAGLRKGIRCGGCGDLNTGIYEGNRNRIVCYECGYKGNLSESVVRNVKEFNLLFPEKRVTTNNVSIWCGGISTRVVRRILIKHFDKKGERHHTYYEC